jgi:hypothetical protein
MKEIETERAGTEEHKKHYTTHIERGGLYYEKERRTSQEMCGLSQRESGGESERVRKGKYAYHRKGPLPSHINPEEKRPL